MASFQQIDDTSYAVQARGSSMVLEQTKKGWRVKTRNAATRVWGLGGESWKDFDTLADVERHYKTWRGIAALIGTPCQQNH
ncbi:TPA: hypothetical protein L5C37_006199 [Pseudomonas aeruginosa]|nr:hypothetical protein [Pseudomonas aeruginosa]